MSYKQSDSLLFSRHEILSNRILHISIRLLNVRNSRVLRAWSKLWWPVNHDLLRLQHHRAVDFQHRGWVPDYRGFGCSFNNSGDNLFVPTAVYNRVHSLHIVDNNLNLIRRGRDTAHIGGCWCRLCAQISYKFGKIVTGGTLYRRLRSNCNWAYILDHYNLSLVQT